MTVVSGLETGAIYAAVINVADYYDGNDVVQRVTAFVDGEETVYLTHKDNAYDFIAQELVTLTIDGNGRISGASYVADATTTTGALEVKTVDSTRLRVGSSSTLRTYASNMAVYLVNEDGEFELGDVSDILVGDYVNLYPASDKVEVIILNLDQEQFTPAP